MLYGRFPTTRSGRPVLKQLGEIIFWASASTMVKRSGCGARAGKPAARSRSVQPL